MSLQWNEEREISRPRREAYAKYDPLAEAWAARRDEATATTAARLQEAKRARFQAKPDSKEWKETGRALKLLENQLQAEVAAFSQRDPPPEEPHFVRVGGPSRETRAMCSEATVAELAAGVEVEILKRSEASSVKPMAQVKVITGKHGGKIGWVLVENLDEAAK